MKKPLLAAVLISYAVGAEIIMAESPEVIRARQYGAEGEITLRVLDSSGLPVRAADVNAGFYNPHMCGQAAEGKTDANGCFIAAGIPVEDMRYSIKKEGYYNTEGTYVFNQFQRESPVKDGRWQPWNPTISVVLKERRRPIAMYAKRVDAIIPLRGGPVGFDVEAGDWVAPHGRGKEADLFFAYSSIIQDTWTFSNQLVIACRNEMNGLYRADKQLWSDFRSTYEADTDGYRPQFVFSLASTMERLLTDERLKDASYLMFRVRTVLDDEGNIVSARYGKIYGPIEYGESDSGSGGKIRFTYYLNPTPNDRNVEFDPEQNLFTDLKISEEVRSP